jgi:hypothetical protein
MKANIIITSILLSSLVNLYAQDYEVSTNIGYDTTQQSSPLDHSYSYGIRASKYLNKNNAIGIIYNYMDKVGDKNSSKESNIHRASLNITHDFQTKNKKLKPYIFAGVGYEYIDEEHNEILSQPFVDYGVGIKYQINDSFNISADMQAIHKLDSSDIDLLSSIGVGMIFGQSERKKPKQPSKVAKLPTLKPKVEKKIEAQKPHNRRITIIKRVVHETKPAVCIYPKNKPTPSYRGKYYVQLMTVFKTDLESTRLPIFRELKERDYHYKIRYPITNGKTSSTLVVGPYQTRDEAKFYLADLKSLKKDAYIIKLK